jgi:hypothetical protein
MTMRTIRMDELAMAGVDAEGRYVVARDGDGELVGVSLAGTDEVLRDLDAVEAGDVVEVGSEEREVVEQVALCDRAG